MDWHARYLQQAAWTRDLRAYLFKETGLESARRVLEVGCGTGAVLHELETPAPVTYTAPNAVRRMCHGLDLDHSALTQASVYAPTASLICGDGLSLPYPDHSFDIVYCHYFLLWVSDPLSAVSEMKRVTRPGGHVLALAEPDYYARVDEPEALRPLGEWQREALKRQGADPGFGTKLAETFFQAGINLKETGIIRGGVDEPTTNEWEMEWAVLKADLGESVPDVEIQKLQSLDAEARAKGERVLYVPTHFAWGRL